MDNLKGLAGFVCRAAAIVLPGVASSELGLAVTTLFVPGLYGAVATEKPAFDAWHFESLRTPVQVLVFRGTFLSALRRLALCQ
jgi:hypothetical protein